MLDFLAPLIAFVRFGPAPEREPARRRRTPAPVPVAQPVAQPERPKTPREIREQAYAMGLRLTGPGILYVLTARSVRRLVAELTGEVPSGSLAKVSIREARECLGRDLAAYIELLVAEKKAVPSINGELELDEQQDRVYRTALIDAMYSDVDLWEAAARARDRDRAKADRAGVTQPAKLHVPDVVQEAIAARAAAALARMSRRQGGGEASSGGGGAVVPPVGRGPKVSRVVEAEDTEEAEEATSTVTSGPK